MKILRYGKNYQEIKKLLIDQEEYPFPFTREYHAFLQEKGQQAFFITDSEGAILPISISSKIGLKIGILLHPPMKNYKRLSIENEHNFLENLIHYIKANKICHHVVQPPNYAIFHSYPINSEYCDFGTFFIDMQRMTENELFLNLKSKYRQAIRAALRKQVVLKFGKSELDPFYMLYEATMKRSNLSYASFEHFRMLLENLTEDHIQCGVAYINDQPVGAQFTVYTHYAGYVLHAASADNIPVRGAIKYLHWENIRLLKQKNVKRFDFVGARLSDVSGTKLEGIQRFKKGFGCHLESGYLWKMDIDPMASHLIEDLVKMKFLVLGKSKKQDIIDQENNILNEA